MDLFPGAGGEIFRWCTGYLVCRIQRIKEVLGAILLALHWPNTSDEERATLFLYVDGLERKLIDLRPGDDADGYRPSWGYLSGQRRRRPVWQ